MQSISHWDPFKELEEMQTRLSLFHRTPVRKNGDKEAMTVPQWIPLVDISEDEKEYLIKAKSPEIKKEGLKINVQDDLLSVSGERKYEREEKNKKYHRVERAYGSFTRSFILPDDADGSRVKADYKDGMLQIHLPKSERVKSKTVNVEVG